MLFDVLKDLVVGAISSGIMFCAHKIWRKMCSSDMRRPQKRYSKKRIHNFFYGSVIALPLFLVAGIGIPIPDGWIAVCMIFLKVCCFLLALFAFIFACGSFDEAMSFYPNYDAIEVPTDESAEKTADNCR